MMTEAELRSLDRLVAMARDEDLGTGDVSARLLPPDTAARGNFIARRELVFCGGPALERIPPAYGADMAVAVLKQDGERVGGGEVIATWEGPARAMTTAERVALNFLQHLSGVATLTRRYVDAVAGTGAAILDTRKTIPGWRDLDKYAVRAGGGTNHRRGLYDAAMIKDNHLACLAAGAGEELFERVAAGIAGIREHLGADGRVILEVDTLEQLNTAVELPIDIILLDNMPPAMLRSAVALRHAAGRDAAVLLEASGFISLDTVAAVAATGVDRISVGAITHSAPAADIGMDIEAAG